MRMKELSRKSGGHYRVGFHSWLAILAVLTVAATKYVLVDAWSPVQHASFSSLSVYFTSCPRIQLLPSFGYRSTSTMQVKNRGLALSSSSSSNEEEQPPAPLPPKKDNDDDVSERFKYKVNALMGVFDPPDAETDTEHKNGNILNAMLKFPVTYAFTVVGKKTTPSSTTDAADNNNDDFVAAVENVVFKESGVAHKNELSTKVTPRGSKFTKVVIKVTVESSDMITGIYDKLQQLEQVVMHY